MRQTVFKTARGLLHAANRAVSPLDGLVSPRHAAPASPIFILGVPRSGTTLAYELVVQAFDVAYLTQIYNYTFRIPKLTTRLLVPRLSRPSARYVSRYGRIAGRYAPAENHLIWEQSFPELPILGHYTPPRVVEPARAAAARSMVESISAISGVPYVFKDVYLTMSLRALLETLPDARIITIQRDSGAVAASLYRAQAGRPARGWWSIRPPFYREYLDADLVERVAFQCVRTEQLMKRELCHVDSKRCLTATYSEICRDPQGFIQRIAAWSGTTPGLRQNADIPARFSERQVSEIPAPTSRRYEGLRAALALDREAYLERVDVEARLRQCSDDQQGSGAG